jgi:hypothetical protein
VPAKQAAPAHGPRAAPKVDGRNLQGDAASDAPGLVDLLQATAERRQQRPLRIAKLKRRQPGPNHVYVIRRNTGKPLANPGR